MRGMRELVKERALRMSHEKDPLPIRLIEALGIVLFPLNRHPLGVEVASVRCRCVLNTDAILGMFTDGDMPERIASTVIARMEGLAPMASWSLGNQLLALRAGTTDARGYRQWEAVGRHVAKGERAVWILAPCTRKLTETDAATGETSTRPIVTGFKAIPVFAYESKSLTSG